MESDIAVLEQAFKKPRVVQPLAIRGWQQRGWVIAGNSQGNLPRARLNPAPMDRHDDRLCLSVISDLFLHQ